MGWCFGFYLFWLMWVVGVIREGGWIVGVMGIGFDGVVDVCVCVVVDVFGCDFEV